MPVTSSSEVKPNLSSRFLNGKLAPAAQGPVQAGGATSSVKAVIEKSKLVGVTKAVSGGHQITATAPIAETVINPESTMTVGSSGKP